MLVASLVHSLMTHNNDMIDCIRSVHLNRDEGWPLNEAVGTQKVWCTQVLGEPKGRPLKGHRKDMDCDECQVKFK